MVYIIFRDDKPFEAYLDHVYRDEKFEQLVFDDKDQEFTWTTMTVELYIR